MNSDPTVLRNENDSLKLELDRQRERVTELETEIERRRANEQVLVANRDRLYALLNVVDVGIWYCDLPFDTLMWDSTVKAHFGLPPDARVTIDTFYERIHPDDRERTRRAIEQSIETHSNYDIEYRTIDEQGTSLRWVRAIGTAFYDSRTGQPRRFDGFTTDITRLKNAQEQLENARKELEKVLETITDGFVAIDRAWCYTYVNGEAARLAGCTRQEMLGRTLWDIFPDVVDTQFYSEMHRARRDLVPFEMEHYHRRLNRWLALRVYPSNNGFTIYYQDVTERRRSEEALKRAKETAEDANRAKSQFLASMSHELRTPLNAIIGYSEMLQEEAGETGAEGMVTDLEKINSAGKHLLSLINDVLDLSKIEAGKMEAYAETFELKHVLGEVASTVLPLIEKNGNRLATRFADDLGTMRSDLTKLRQSLFNLLSNAAKFTQGGEIRLSAWREVEDGQEWCVFEVHDNGIGIPAEKLVKVFDPFAQADSSTARNFGGTGLGLTLTRRFCQILGGDINVESEPGSGSTFTIRLPAELPNRERPVELSAGESRSSAGEGPLILVIDDDESARDLIRRHLVREGFAVELAGSGEEGLRKAREMSPTAITLDVMMPGMDGWAVLQALKAASVLSSIPVILVTMVEDRSLGYTLGATDYLVKPVTRDRLSEVLKRYQCDPPCTVLLVEDDAEQRELMSGMLHREGWEVLEAADGIEGLERLEETRPQLVLLDLLLPRLDGFEFAAQVRRQPRWLDVPIVVLTAKDLTAEDHQRLNGKVQQILSKGEYSREMLMQEMRRLVRRATAHHQPSVRG